MIFLFLTVAIVVLVHLCVYLWGKLVVEPEWSYRIVYYEPYVALKTERFTWLGKETIEYRYSRSTKLWVSKDGKTPPQHSYGALDDSIRAYEHNKAKAWARDELWGKQNG